MAVRFCVCGGHPEQLSRESRWRVELTVDALAPVFHQCGSVTERCYSKDSGADTQGGGVWRAELRTCPSQTGECRPASREKRSFATMCDSCKEAREGPGGSNSDEKLLCPRSSKSLASSCLGFQRASSCLGFQGQAGKGPPEVWQKPDTRAWMDTGEWARVCHWCGGIQTTKRGMKALIGSCSCLSHLCCGTGKRAHHRCGGSQRGGERGLTGLECGLGLPGCGRSCTTRVQLAWDTEHAMQGLAHHSFL